MKEKAVILCVDDENMVLVSLRQQLKRNLERKYILETAESGEEALEIVEELKGRNIDLPVVLSDHIMPGMNGDEFFIKVHKKYPSIVKIMLTGQANEGAINRAKEHADLFAVLYKPWSEHELFNIIKSGLGKNE